MYLVGYAQYCDSPISTQRNVFTAKRESEMSASMRAPHSLDSESIPNNMYVTPNSFALAPIGALLNILLLPTVKR